MLPPHLMTSPKPSHEHEERIPLDVDVDDTMRHVFLDGSGLLCIRAFDDFPKSSAVQGLSMYIPCHLGLHCCNAMRGGKYGF